MRTGGGGGVKIINFCGRPLWTALKGLAHLIYISGSLLGLGVVTVVPQVGSETRGIMVRCVTRISAWGQKCGVNHGKSKYSRVGLY